jgi:hypothetical protein
MNDKTAETIQYLIELGFKVKRHTNNTVTVESGVPQVFVVEGCRWFKHFIYGWCVTVPAGFYSPGTMVAVANQYGVSHQKLKKNVTYVWQRMGDRYMTAKQLWTVERD